MKRIKVGDTVIITAGKNKGHIGKILKIASKENGFKVIVEGGNLVYKAVKPNPNVNEQGGIIQREAFIDSSNVAHYNPQTKKADKIGIKHIEKADGSKIKVRYFKSNQELIDVAV